MPKARQQLKPQELRILKALLEHSYHLSTAQVAEIANVSWNTADKYLEKFRKKHWIERVQRGNRNYWRAYRE
jgi:predicted transcriptional regulator